MQHFSLQSRTERPSEPAESQKAVSILVVEDNPADVGLVREALEEHGVEGQLLVVADGHEAMRVIDNIESGQVSCPDLFIVDLNLPKEPGREVLKRLRLSEKCRHAPVVILSSSDAQRDRDDAEGLGVSRYIRKPFRLEEFISLGGVFKAMLGSSAR